MYFFAFLLHFTRFFTCNNAGRSLIFNYLYTQTAPLSIFNVFFVLIFTLACAHQRFRMLAFIPYACMHLFLTHARIYSLRMRARIYLRNARACDEHKCFFHSVFFLGTLYLPYNSRRVPAEFL